MSLVTGQEAKRAGGSRSEEESALPCMVTISEEAIIVSSGSAGRVHLLRTDEVGGEGGGRTGG